MRHGGFLLIPPPFDSRPALRREETIPLPILVIGLIPPFSPLCLITCSRNATTLPRGAPPWDD